MTSPNGDASGGGGGGGGLVERSASLNQGMTEYIGFVNIVLVRGKNLVSAGFGQVRAWHAVERDLQPAAAAVRP